ncbi:MAG TPA: serine hydrolase domain-containing protein [Actinomycetota bacterium]|nr:serine hydrolase domain-containing protein [Actinomycetota bacterium]
MDQLEWPLDRIAAETGFSGVVRVDRAGVLEFVRAYGLSDRAHGIPNTVDTQFGLASGAKGLTALAVVSLIEEGRLELKTPARSFLREDLPLIDAGVTVEHLLAHRSGIGDYLDEEEDYSPSDYVLTVAPHELTTTERYLRILDGHPTKFRPGERFSYSNGGYVVLALIAERASGVAFPELVTQLVCQPAGMVATEFLRSDELPGSAAFGYLETEGLRTNVFHLPVRGSGDGGIYSTAGDVHALWTAFFEGRIVSPRWVSRMVNPLSQVPSESRRYGLGFWLHESRDDVVMLEGGDAGVSFRSVHDRGRNLTYTVISNTTRGAWPIARRLDELLA